MTKNKRPTLLRFKQIAAATDYDQALLYGLDDDGMVWEYNPNTKHWLGLNDEGYQLED